jgi:hypothetical protein
MPGGGGPWTYGLDRYGAQLLVSMSYAGEVRTYSNMSGNNLVQAAIYSTTGLAEPNADVEEVWSTARAQDGRTFFAWGDFHGGVNGHGILQRTTGGMWSMFETGDNLWNNSPDGVMLTAGIVGGTEYLFASADSVLYKFRVSDNKLITQYDLEISDWARDMEIDSKGNLWYGGDGGVWAFDVSGDTHSVLAARGGVECSRMALREEGATTHVYCVRFRDPAVIGHLPVDLP